MPLILITGVAGTGKSAICEQLNLRGYEAYDTDKKGLSGWFDRSTGVEIVQPKSEWGNRPPSWYVQNEWRTSVERVRLLAPTSAYHPVYLCGGSSNRAEIAALCDKIIGLTVSENELRRRLAERKNPYGKQEHELEKILSSRRINERNLIALGANIIDTNRPLAEVVDDIIASST